MNLILAFCVCVLASINALASTRHGEAFTTVASVTWACKAFKDEHGVFPAEETWFDELTGTHKAVINKRRIGWANLATTNDPWGNPYIYKCPGKHNTHSIDFYSRGRDGLSKTGGDDPDDISNWYAPNRRNFYTQGPLVTPLRILMSAFILLTLFAYALMRKLKFAGSEDRTLCWTRNLIVYYAASLMVCDASSTAFFLVHPDILFGLIPFVVSIAGFIRYRTKGERIVNWLLFSLTTLWIIFHLLLDQFLTTAR
jgi:general secretion pathway protein G